MGATLDRSSNGDVTLLTKSAARVALEQATVWGAVTKLKFRKRPDQASFEPHMLGLLVAALSRSLSGEPGNLAICSRTTGVKRCLKR
jgi:hypothetical protein